MPKSSQPASRRSPDSGLREDEQFAITAVAATFAATWRPGENPPDAYLVLDAKTVAVEISTLTQYVT
jgi:hypothetical protein